MVIYNVSIEERIAKLVSKSSQNSVNGNKGDEVHFTFDSEWQGHDKKVALFVWGGKYYPVEFTGNICTVPPLYNTNNFRLGVYVGETTDSSAYLSSTEIEIPCKLSIRDFAKSSHGEVGKNYTYEARGYAESAKISEENSKKSEENAKLSETNAYNSEVASKNSEISARNDAEIARQFAGNTEQIEARISRNDKRITNLEQGLVPSPFVTDDSVAYIKDVPLNALPYAEINKIGGMTYKDGDTLKHAKVTEIKSVGVNVSDISSPTSGYFSDSDGTQSNADSGYICFYVLEVLPNITYTISSNLRIYSVWEDDGIIAISKRYISATEGTLTTGETTKRLRITLFNTSGNMDTTAFEWFMINKGSTALPCVPYTKNTLSIPESVRPKNGVNKSIYDYIEWYENGTSKKYELLREAVFDGREYWNIDSTGNRFYTYIDNFKESQHDVLSDRFDCAIWDTLYVDIASTGASTIDEFKAILSTKPLVVVYELAEPIITDISDILPADNFIGVEGGGTITVVNEYEYAVPTEITYQIKEATL